MLAASRSRDGKDDTAIPFVNAIKSLPQRQPVILLYLTYLQDLRVFERVYEQNKHDLRRTLDAITALAEDAEQPFEAVRRVVYRVRK